MLLTLTTNCDSGALVTTQRTHSYLILFLITPAFSGAQKWVDWLHNPCLLGGAQ